MSVIGIDPSLNGTGISTDVTEAYSLVFKNRKNDPKGDDRLATIRRTLHLEIIGLGIDLAIVEAVPPYGKGSAALGLVQGVVREVLSANNVMTFLLSPSPLKKFATGNGKASKEEMRGALLEHPHLDDDMDEVQLWDDNAVDAWWLREVGLAFRGLPHHGQKASVYDVRTMLKKV